MSKSENKDTKVNQNWLTIMNVAICIATLCFFASLFFDIREVIELDMDLSKSGKDNFIETFLTSFKIGAAIIEILTIRSFLANNNQTERIIAKTQQQIEIYAKNENLKNFFLHKEEFHKYIKDLDFLEVFFKENSINSKNISIILYRHFFYSGYADFKPELSSSHKEQIRSYLNLIKCSNINSITDSTSTEHSLFTLYQNIIPNTKNVIEEVVKVKMKDMNEQNDNIKKALCIKIAKQLYESILLFDGSCDISMEIYDTFEHKINDYINNNSSKKISNENEG